MILAVSPALGGHGAEVVFEAQHHAAPRRVVAAFAHRANQRGKLFAVLVRLPVDELAAVDAHAFRAQHLRHVDHPAQTLAFPDSHGLVEAVEQVQIGRQSCDFEPGGADHRADRTHGFIAGVLRDRAGVAVAGDDDLDAVKAHLREQLHGCLQRILGRAHRVSGDLHRFSFPQSLERSGSPAARRMRSISSWVRKASPALVSGVSRVFTQWKKWRIQLSKPSRLTTVHQP